MILPQCSSSSPFQQSSLPSHLSRRGTQEELVHLNSSSPHSLLAEGLWNPWILIKYSLDKRQGYTTGIRLQWSTYSKFNLIIMMNKWWKFMNAPNWWQIENPNFVEKLFDRNEVSCLQTTFPLIIRTLHPNMNEAWISHHLGPPLTLLVALP